MTTTNTSRPASGTPIRFCKRTDSHEAHEHGLGGQYGYRWCPGEQLKHAMDADPFAGLPADEPPFRSEREADAPVATVERGGPNNRKIRLCNDASQHGAHDWWMDQIVAGWRHCPGADGQDVAEETDAVREMRAEGLNVATVDRSPADVWVLVDDFGDGAPAAGPFDTYEQAAAHDPHDDRFEPKRMTRAEAEKALAARRRETEEFYTALRTAGQKQAQAKAAEPAFPPAEPEPSMSLTQFQQRVKTGAWHGTKPAPVAPHDPHQRSSYGLAILAALGQRGRHVYGGTVDHATKQHRRAKNRAARRSRRVNRINRGR